MEITEIETWETKEERFPVSGSISFEKPTNGHAQEAALGKFIKEAPIKIDLSETTLKATEKATEFVGSVTEEGVGAAFDLFKMVIGKDQKTEKPSSPEEKKKKQEEAVYTRQFYQQTEAEKARVSQAENEKAMKAILEATGKPVMTDEDKKDLDLNTGLDIKHIKNPYHLNQLRAKQLAKINAAKKAKQQQQMVQTAPKGKGGNFDLNKVGEGGSILSTTGGAGAG